MVVFVLAFAVSFFYLFRGLFLREKSWLDHFPVSFFWIGLGGYALVSWLLTFYFHVHEPLVVWLDGLRHQLIAIIYVIAVFFEREYEDEVLEGHEPFQSVGEFTEEMVTESSLIMDIINYIVQVFILLVIVVVISYLAYKWGKKLVIALMRWLHIERDIEEVAYRDEHENLLNLHLMGQSWTGRFHSFFVKEQKIKWADLKNNKERIRFLYRYYIEKRISEGYTYEPHLSPQETIQDLQRWQSHKSQPAQQLSDI